MKISMEIGKPKMGGAFSKPSINGTMRQTIRHGGTTDYDELENRPQINSVTLTGNLSSADLGLQAALTFDSEPTQSSTNPVESGGVYNALSAKADGNNVVNSWNGQKGAVTYTAPVSSVNGQTGAVSLSIPTVPTNVSAFNNDANYITAAGAPVQSVNGMIGDVTGLQPAGDYAAAASGDSTKTAVKTASIPYAQVDDTSTSTAFTATVPGITEYKHGVCCMLKNGVVTSASGFTVNVNGLGAKPVYNSMAAATADTTLFNINYTMLFIYDETRVTGGCWVMYRGYNSDTNTIGYQIRTNSSTLPAADKTYRYRLLFTSADGQSLVPANTSTSTNATAVRTPNTRAFDPFGGIYYYNYTTAINAGSNFGTSYIMEQMSITLGYSFNSTGAALDMPFPRPVYIKATPQADGSAVLDANNPYVFSLPTTEDGSIYIFLGRTYSATNVELMLNHPVYHYYNGAVRAWTGPV